jgi:hypothetical protein
MDWIADVDIVQRSVVLEVLRDDHGKGWSRDELAAEIYDVEPHVIGTAIACLRRGGVVRTLGDQVWATSAVRHLDGLGMVCI